MLIRARLFCDITPGIMKLFLNADVFVYDKNTLWLYNAILAKKFFLTPMKNKIKIILKVFWWRQIHRWRVEASQMLAWKLPDQEEFSFFISVHLGCDFTPLAPPPLPPNSHHPWTINISTSQSIFIIKHMPNAVCGCEDTGLLFIHLIYLYFFPEGETLVSICADCCLLQST